MSTHPYKHRSKPSKRSIRLSTWNSRIFSKPATEASYDGGMMDHVRMDEMSQWEEVSPKSRKVGMTQARKFIETLEPLNK